MYLFMIIVFPAVFLYRIVADSNSAQMVSFFKKNALVSVLGFFTSCIAAGGGAFFTFYRPFTSSSFILCFLRSFFSESFFPALMYTVFFFWSKDGIEEKIRSFFLYCAPFYAVWMPFIILRNSASPSYFMLFIKPLLVLCMVCSVSVELQRAIKSLSLSDKKNMKKNVVIIAVEILMPSAVEAFWYFSVLHFVWFLFAVVYILWTVYYNRRFIFCGAVEAVIDREMEAGKDAVKKILKNRFPQSKGN